jgi:ketosteroid isomerase-like protein
VGEAENIELMRAGYERWNATGRLPLELFHPDIEWNNPISDTGVARGHEGVQQDMAELRESFEFMQNLPERIAARGDLVVVVVRTTIRGRGSGVEWVNRAAHVWTIRDDLAMRFEVYEDVDAALRLVET